MLENNEMLSISMSFVKLKIKKETVSELGQEVSEFVYTLDY